MKLKIISIFFLCMCLNPLEEMVYAKHVQTNYKIEAQRHKSKMKELDLPLKERLLHADSALYLAKKHNNPLLEADIYLVKGTIYSMNGNYATSIKISNQALAILSKVKNTDQSAYFNELYSKVLNNIGYSQAYCSNYTEALNCFSKLMHRYESDSSVPYAAWAYNGFAYIYITQEKYKEAEFYAQKALLRSRQLNNAKLIYGSYANLGDIYYRQGLYDQALGFFLEQQKIATTHSFNGDAPIHSSWNMAEIYHKKKQDVIAEQYYLNALKLAKSQNQPLFIVIQSAYGVFLMETNRSNDAISLFLNLLKGNQLDNYNEYKINVLQSLTKLYEKKGDYKNAMNYLKECYHLRDSNYIRETSEKLDLLQQDFDGYKLSAEQKLSQQNKGLEQSNNQKKNLLIALLSVLCLLILVLMSYFISRILKQRKLNALLNEKIDWIHTTEDQRIEEKKQALVDNFNEKYKKLLPESLVAAQFAGEIETLKQKITLLKTQIPHKEDTSQLISSIENILKSFSSEKQWAEFKLLFEQSGEHLYESLQKVYPQLNSLDMRLCVLISMNLTTKEIASLTHKSVRGIESAKFRLRKKMNLSPEVDLYEMITACKQ
ncbi:MAG: tetratricopeptide repeat protein [Bacteroidales bacterium]